jgi:hypothetical protein
MEWEARCERQPSPLMGDQAFYLPALAGGGQKKRHSTIVNVEIPDLTFYDLYDTGLDASIGR